MNGSLYYQYINSLLSNFSFSSYEISKLYHNNYNVLLAIILKFQPFLLLLLLPGFIVLIFYVSLLIIYLYKLKHLVFSFFGNSVFTDTSLRWFLSIIWCIKSRILHGYEIIGMDKIPINESAYLVYFHGTLPLDIYYFATNFIMLRKKLVLLFFRY